MKVIITYVKINFIDKIQMKGCRNPKTQKSLSKSNTSSQPDKKKEPLAQKPNLDNYHARISKTPNRNLSKTMCSNSKQKQKCRQLPSKQLNNIQNICSFKFRFNKENKKPSKNGIKTKRNVSGTRDKQKMRKQDEVLRGKYVDAVSKVFHVLDIFSRGSIGQANISRWVPEAALYFLGAVFQKIRNKRITLNQQQFQQQCEHIFQKSHETDIQQFIDNIFKHSNFNDEKQSYDGELKETVESQVEDRFSFRVEGQHSFRQIKPTNNTMPLKTTKNNESNPATATKQKPQAEQRNLPKISRPSPLTQLNQYENVAQNGRHRKIKDSQNMPLQANKRNNQNNKPSHGHLQSPFFQVSISNVIARVANGHRKCSIDSDRIDKLSLRLEDYIRENAARIQRSKICREEL